MTRLFASRNAAKRLVRLGHLTAIGAAALLFGLATPALAQWQPNETRASPQTDLIDYEFSQSRGMFAWNDCCGKLWIGKVDRATGLFEPSDGKFMLIDPDSMTYADARKTKNGPEWVSTSIGDVIVYTRYNGYHTDGNSRIGYAYPVQGPSLCNYTSADGYWCATNLGPDVPRKAPYGSHTPGDPAPRISYVDHREVHYWRELWNPASERMIPDFPDSNFPLRQTECAAPGVPGARSLVYPQDVGGIEQVFMRDYDSGAVTQLTFDAGQKYEVWMWCAPEFGNDLVLSTLVDQVELRVYRRLPVGPGGSLQWTPIFSQLAPPGNQIFSPEPFVYAGKSYILMSHMVQPNTFRSQVWISNIDAAAPMFKRITPLIPLQTRTDPEVFITDNGPYIYYNVFENSTRPNGQPKRCRDPETCSLGVWFADPGLKAQAP